MSNIKGRQIGKITAEELKLIQDQQNKVNSILVEIGYQETRKHALLHDLADRLKNAAATKKLCIMDAFFNLSAETSSPVSTIGSLATLTNSSTAFRPAWIMFFLVSFVFMSYNYII